MKKLAIILFACSFVQLYAQKDLAKTIESLLEKQYPSDGPGGAILVAKKGKILYEGGFGMADIGNEVKNTSSNQYKIGSITKQFTAVAILMLEEEKKLSVDDLVTKYLPDYPEHQITIRQLLNHTSGIPNYTNMSWFMENVEIARTTEEMLDVFKDEPLDFEPGTSWNYSNSGYIVLGAIIESLSSIGYGEFIETKIFKKLGMNNSVYGRDNTEYPNLAVGYSPSQEGFVPALSFSMSLPHAAGSIISTVNDQLIWIQAIRDNKLISKESKEKAWTSAILPDGTNTHYGFGWMQNEVNGHPSIEHGGGIFGFVTSGIYLPEDDVFVSILTNRDGASPDEIGVRIAAAVAGDPYVIENPLDLTEEQAEEYVAVYDFEDGSSRTITREGNQLFSQKSGSTRLKIFPIEKDHFVFEGVEMSRLEFKRNNMNRIGGAVMHFRIDEIKGKRTNKEIVVREEMNLSPKELKRFEGEYQLAPEFSIKVYLKGEVLFAQATGQPEFEIFAMSKTRFFLKVVDAEIEFYEGEDGAVESMTLFQGGREMPGKKIK